MILRVFLVCLQPVNPVVGDGSCAQMPATSSTKIGWYYWHKLNTKKDRQVHR